MAASKSDYKQSLFFQQSPLHELKKKTREKQKGPPDALKPPSFLLYFYYHTVTN